MGLVKQRKRRAEPQHLFQYALEVFDALLAHGDHTATLLSRLRESLTWSELGSQAVQPKYLIAHWPGQQRPLHRQQPAPHPRAAHCWLFLGMYVCLMCS